MEDNNQENINEKVKEEIGMIPPAFKIAEKMGDDFKDLIGDYYEIIYTDDVIPYKYKYLMAIVHGIITEHKPKVMIDTKKALKYGATPEEIKEVLKMTIWWCGSPTMVKLVPDVLQYLEKEEKRNKEDDE